MTPSRDDKLSRRSAKKYPFQHTKTSQNRSIFPGTNNIIEDDNDDDDDDDDNNDNECSCIG